MIRYKGIALVQILILSAMLSVFALYLSKNAHEQVQMSKWAVDKNEAFLSSYSTEKRLLFSLLTNEKFRVDRLPSTNEQGFVNEVPLNWNFHGDAFNVNNKSKVEIQDLSGLLNLRFIEPELLKQFIAFYSTSNDDPQRIISHLLDWQDVDTIPRGINSEINEPHSTSSALSVRNGPLPFLAELQRINVIDDELYRRLNLYTTLHTVGPFNPMNSPKELLEVFLDSSIVEEVENRRKSGAFGKREFSLMTGLVENETMFFYPSNYIRIEIETTIGEVVDSTEYILHLKPYAESGNSPVNVLYRKN